MSALTDIQRALNIIRKVVDAQHKNIGLDALVLLNQTAASLSTLLKDKPRAQRPQTIPIVPRKAASTPTPKQSNPAHNSIVKPSKTRAELAPIKPQAPLHTKSFT